MRVFLFVATILIGTLLSTTGAWSEPAIAVRGEGYIGYSNLDVGSLDEDAFQGGGAGSVSLVTGNLYMQADIFGDSTEFDDLDATSIGGALHLGWRDAERGAFGVMGSVDHLDLDASGAISGDADADIWRGGVESELFFGPVSLAGNVGLLEVEDDTTGYLDLGLSYYPVERARVHIGGGVADIEEDDPYGLIGAGGEFLLLDPVAAFVRWEATLVDTQPDFEQHSIVVGARLYWGGETPSLLNYDRAHFKRTCSSPILALARGC